MENKHLTWSTDEQPLIILEKVPLQLAGMAARLNRSTMGAILVQRAAEGARQCLGPAELA